MPFVQECPPVIKSSFRTPDVALAGIAPLGGTTMTPLLVRDVCDSVVSPPLAPTAFKAAWAGSLARNAHR